MSEQNTGRSEPAYPILPRPEDDPRFALGLIVDVAALLERHGYPPVTHWSDSVDLKMALFHFLYGRSGGAA